VNSGKSYGMLTYKGDVYAKAVTGHAADSSRIVFQMAMLKGMSYTALDANVTETYYNMDSVEVAATAAGTFYFYPFQDTNMDQKHTNYYILRIRGRYSTNAAAIVMKEERIEAQ